MYRPPTINQHNPAFGKKRTDMCTGIRRQGKFERRAPIDGGGEFIRPIRHASRRFIIPAGSAFGAEESPPQIFFVEIIGIREHRFSCHLTRQKEEIE